MASWGAPVEFKAAKLLSVKPATKDGHLSTVLIDVGPIAGDYRKGGQFVQVKVGDSKPGFFAIASPPDPNNMGVLEFLIKSQPGSTAELLCKAKEGEEVYVSPVMGKGFPIDKIPPEACPTVLLFATGSGISPVRALIESGSLEVGKRQDVRLYYGTRNADSTAYLDRIPEWESEGVKVVPVFSDKVKSYVQDVFKQNKEVTEFKEVGVVLCGQKEMCNAIKEELAADGVEADRILLNF